MLWLSNFKICLHVCAWLIDGISITYYVHYD